MSTPSTPRPASNTQTITRNSFWYGLELLVGLGASLVVSAILARVVGAERLGPYTYVMWLTNITAALGAFGLPMTARKYMAEYINRGELGLARAIYGATLRLQFWIAAAITAAALLLVVLFGDPRQRLISVLLVVNMAPRIVGLIPSQANNAAEILVRNTVPAVLSGILNLALSLFSIWIGWDLPGVAAALLAGTLFDTIWKLSSVHRWFGGTVPTSISPELRKQMFVYSGHGLVLMLLNIVVWDRSDLLFLKWLNPDISQVTYFSYSFNLVERLLMFPNAFAGSLGITIMAQYGRGEEKIRQLTVDGARYAFLIALPLLAGMASVSGPAALLLYGARFRPIVPVLTVVAALAIPKALTAPPTTLLQTTGNQGFLVVWSIICGVVNVVLDLLLTPGYGAVGAAVANGSAQTIATLGIWAWAWRLFRPDLRLGAFFRIAVSGAGMAAVAIALGRVVPGYAGLAAAVLGGALAWFILLRATGAIDATDGQRLLNVGKALPGRFRPAWSTLVAFLVRPQSTPVPLDV